MEGEAKALLRVWSTILASLCYCYFVSSKIPSGKPRLFSLLPVFSLHAYLPLSLSSTLPTGITAFFVTWLGDFKLILYAFDQGPLSKIESFPKFMIISIFPIKIKDDPSEREGREKVLPLGFWSKTLIFSLLVGACDLYKGRLPWGVVLVFYCCMLYLFIDMMMGLCNQIVGPILGVELSQPSDEPYVATSLQDFWGRRWNLMVPDALRRTVYRPTRAFLSNRVGVDLAHALAVTTSFLVSGLMHELIFYYITRASPTWEVTCFFALHGLCLVLEIGLKRASGLGRDRGLHGALAGPLTVGFVVGTGFWLFLPQLVRNQVDVRSLEEVKAIGRFLKGVKTQFS